MRSQSTVLTGCGVTGTNCYSSRFGHYSRHGEDAHNESYLIKYWSTMSK